MKVIKHENGVEFVPESDFERECLNHISKGCNVQLTWTNNWNNNGNLMITFNKDDWGL